MNQHSASPQSFILVIRHSIKHCICCFGIFYHYYTDYNCSKTPVFVGI